MAASKFRIASSSFTSDATFSGSVIFNQDVTVSGTLNVYEMKTTLVSSSIIFKSGSTKFGDTSDDLHQFTGSAEFSSGLSGSLTKLVDGTSYLVAGTNITITTASNGQITIDSSGGGASGDIEGVTAGTGLSGGGSTGTVTLDIDDSVVATLSGSQFSGNVGITGSLGITSTLDVDGTLSVAEYISCTTDSNTFIRFNGADTIQFRAGGITMTQITESPGEDGQDVFIHNPDNNDVDFQINTSNANGTIFVDSADDSVIIGHEGFDVTPAASEVSGYGTDVKVYISGSIGAKDTSTRGVTLIAGDSIVSGTLYAPNAISGSLTKLTDGTSYLVAGTNVTITTASNGSVAISSTADQNVFSTIAVAGQTNVVADATTDTLTFVESGGMTITTDASTDTITFSSANTTYTAGTGLSLSSTEFNLDFSELTDMTSDIAGTTEFILQDGTTESRKAASEIKLSAFNNDAGFTTNTGDITSVSAGTGLSGGGSSGAVTIDIDNSVVATISGSTFTGPITFSQNAVTASTILDTSNNKLLSLNSGIVINEDGIDVDFRIGTNDNGGMFLIDGGTNQILLNNNPNSRFAADEFLNGSARGGLGTDTGIYLSGSRGSINTPDSKGVTTIVGDLVVSGNIYHDTLGISPDAVSGTFLESNQIVTNLIIGSDGVAPFGQGRDTDTSIQFLTDEIRFFAGNKRMLSLDVGSASHVIVNDNSEDINFRVETNNLIAALYTDGGTDQVILGGNTNNIANYLLGTDVNILLSGTIGSKGTSTKGTVVASGDFVVSGSFHNPGIVHVGAFQSSAISNISTNTFVRVPFNSVLKGNTRGGFDASTGIFTAPVDGYYQINSMVGLLSIDTAASDYRLYVTASDGFKILLDSFVPAEMFPAGDTASSGVPNALRGSTTLFLSEDQAASVFIVQTGGSAQTDIQGKLSNDGLDGSNITITKIG